MIIALRKRDQSAETFELMCQGCIPERAWRTLQQGLIIPPKPRVIYSANFADANPSLRMNQNILKAVE